MKYKKEFELAKEISIEVGAFLKIQKNKKILSQKNKDIKIELDFICENMIIKKLNENFDYPILSEEAGLNKELLDTNPYWIVDPIDGTLNFSRDNPSSCISIAFWIKNEPIFGIIYDFNRDELFNGYIGYEVYCNNTKLVKKTNSIQNAILATGFPSYLNTDENTLKEYISNIQKYKKIRMIGSAALSLAYVASNKFDTYMENNIKLWDIAAGIAINQAIGNNIQIEFLEDYKTNVKVGVFL